VSLDYGTALRAQQPSDFVQPGLQGIERV